ncbi:Thrombin inhibitor rhodniin [Armadillidium nasatum]|uniref:Thrombin inhibitor rhodniin n=1 Tax=Armadillidium nasatum TaxID=96803 RepID=A0A5N5SKL4_9CRUS|nr:Thrombin inhibitor rhodniin [Armadillidium nasatum]
MEAPSLDYLLDSPLYVTGFRNEGQQCAIPFILRPVCGSNGVTYDNNWALECEQRKNPGLRLAHEGPC